MPGFEKSKDDFSSLWDRLEGIEPIPEHLLDSRSDEAIVAELLSFTPVTSEKNIWAFWQTGWGTMKPWTQRNVIGWARRHPDWTIRVLDRVTDSPLNVCRYLADEYFPVCFLDQSMSGPYAPAHSADLVRLPCLYEYGGVWLDVSIILFRSLEDICWNVLQGSNQYELAGFVLEDVHKDHQHSLGYLENWFIAAKKGDPWISRWHKVFLAYWSDAGRVESKGVTDHALFRHLDFGGYRSDMIDYLAQHVSYQRLRLLEDPSDGFNGPRYFQKHMYLLSCRNEGYYLPHTTKWQGQVAFDLMQSPYTPPCTPTSTISPQTLKSVFEKIQGSSDRKSAEIKAGNAGVVGKYCNGTLTPPETTEFATFVTNNMITNTCLSKSVHGFKGDTQLSDLWNADEHVNIDVLEGSCAAVLRWASTHVQQTRRLVPLVVGKIDGERVIREPLLP